MRQQLSNGVHRAKRGQCVRRSLRCSSYGAGAAFEPRARGLLRARRAPGPLCGALCACAVLLLPPPISADERDAFTDLAFATRARARYHGPRMYLGERDAPARRPPGRRGALDARRHGPGCLCAQAGAPRASAARCWASTAASCRSRARGPAHNARGMTAGGIRARAPPRAAPRPAAGPKSKGMRGQFFFVCAALWVSTRAQGR